MSQNLQLDPYIPHCWESPHTLRFGFDTPRLRLNEPCEKTQTLINALTIGLPRANFFALADKIGFDKNRALSLLTQLRPVLSQTPAQTAQKLKRTPIKAVLNDDGLSVKGLARELARVAHISFHSPSINNANITNAAGTTNASSTPNTLETTENKTSTKTPGRATDHPANINLVFLIEHYLASPHRAALWLSRGIPHMPIRFSDSMVQIGPIIRPEGAPCHYCICLTLGDKDPSLPRLASQLQGERAPSATEEVARATAPLAAALISRLIAGDEDAHTSFFTLPVRHGLPDANPREQKICKHVSCACGLLN